MVKIKRPKYPHVAANGQTEWGGTFFRHVRPAMLNYRHNTNVLGHQIVAFKVGHGDYIDVGGSPGWGIRHPGKVRCVDTWKYLSVFIDKAISLRVPEGYPTDAPFELKQVDPSKGMLIKPHAIEDMFQKERLPLIKEGGAENTEAPSTLANGFATIPAPNDYEPGEGVPVVGTHPRHGPPRLVAG